MPWLQLVKGKLSLTARAGFLPRHLHQIPWNSDVRSPMTRRFCYTLQIALQAMSHGGLRCSLNKGSCRRSSDAMTTWRSQCDAHCALKQWPKMMSRPGPKSGTRSSHCSRPFDQNNTCSSWCEGCGPIRRVHGKRPRRYAVNTSRAEALRRTATKGARSHPTQVLDSTLCAPPRGHTFSCAPHSGHMTLPSSFKFATLHCRLVLQAGVADCSATMFQTDWDCSGCLPMCAPSSECGDMLQPAFFLRLNPVAATLKPRPGPHWDPDPCR